MKRLRVASFAKTLKFKHRLAQRVRRVPSFPGVWQLQPLIVSNSHYFHSPHCNTTTTMARGVEGNEMSTPRASQKKQPASASQSAKGQKSILGFFQKKSTNSPSPAPSDATPVNKTPTSRLAKKAFNDPPAAITPVPSSDAPDYSSPIKQEHELTIRRGRNKENGVLLHVLKSDSTTDSVLPEPADVTPSSPTRKVRATCHCAF